MTQSEALKILKTGTNVFLTGEPGSGKTYVINQYVSYLHSHGILPAITASTGIAATHIGGMTIHSWCGIGIKNRLSSYDLSNIASNAYVKKRVGNANILIIDEISMLPPNTLQMVDAICREVKKSHLPFGGMQVVLVGDFFQLPPVTKNIASEFSEFQEESLFEEKPMRFAYDAPVFEQSEFVNCYITEQHRQDDSDLLSLLSKIRSNSFDNSALQHIQSRKVDIFEVPADAPKLYSHNSNVDMMNEEMLAKIPGEAQFFPMQTKGHIALVEVMKKGCLSPENLFLKIGASVMFTKNNAKEGFANGTLGVVESFNTESGLPEVRLRNGHKVTVELSDWTVEEDGEIKGLLSQLPLRLAWAITVHKSQGISLDEAVIDLSRVFEFGQGYVAISRIKRLSGMYILGWNEKAFQVDPEVLEKDIEFRQQSENAEKVFSHFREQDLKRMQEEFIVRCGGELKASEFFVKKKKVKATTYDETLKLWQEGKNIKDIALTRNLSDKTIFSHIEELYEKKKISKDDLMQACSDKLKKDLPKIHIAFKKLNTDKLTPVFEYFQALYSYDDLKLARMLIK